MWLRTSAPLGNYGSKRFLIPDPQGPSRDAFGELRPIVAFGRAGPGAPALVPASGALYRRAPCYDSFNNLECGSTICDCLPPPTTDPARGCGNAGAIARGKFPDCNFYAQSTSWSNAGLDCRTYNQSGSGFLPVRVAGRLADILNSWLGAWTTCTMNAMVACIGKTAGAACGRTPPIQNVPPFHLGEEFNPTRQVFMRLHVTRFSAAFGVPADAVSGFEHDAVRDLKNSVMRFIESDQSAAFESLLHLDQVEHDNPTQPNANLGFYSRAFNGDGRTDCADLPTVAVWPNCRAYGYDRSISVAIRVAFATVQVSVLPVHLTETIGLNREGSQIYPHLRARVEVRLAARVISDFPDLAVEQEPDRNEGRSDCTRVPRVNGRSIVLIDNRGRRLISFPFELQWLGYKGPLTNESVSIWNDRPSPYAFTDHGRCCFLAFVLNDALSTILGWPTTVRRNEEGYMTRRDLYTGSLGFKFDFVTDLNQVPGERLCRPRP
jgi:hypothetical protein